MLNVPIRRLPSCPGVARMVLELCRQGTADLGLVSDVLMADPGIAARILRFANAPGLSSHGQVISVRDAVLSLGIRASKMAALGFILPTDLAQRCPHFDLRSFWSQNLLRAAVARHIVAPSLAVDREAAFTAVLLADVGQLAIAASMPSEYGQILAIADSPASQRALERERLGTDQATAGANLLANWGLPAKLTDAIAAGSDSDPPRGNALARVVYESRCLIDAAAHEGDGTGPSELEAVCERLGISRTIWDSAIESIDQDYLTTTELFEEQLSQADAEQLLADAQLETSNMASRPRIDDFQSSNFTSTNPTR